MPPPGLPVQRSACPCRNPRGSPLTALLPCQGPAGAARDGAGAGFTFAALRVVTLCCVLQSTIGPRTQPRFFPLRPTGPQVLQSWPILPTPLSSPSHLGALPCGTLCLGGLHPDCCWGRPCLEVPTWCHLYVAILFYSLRDTYCLSSLV